MLSRMINVIQKDTAADFRALMALYEDNYVRFGQLARGLDGVGDTSVSKRLREVDLCLRVLERGRYTTTVSLTYRFQSGGGERMGETGETGEKPLSAPDMKIKLYHDSRQAEVLSCHPGDARRFRWLRRSSCRSTIQWRWRMNRFLFKWLNYCLKSGHGFPQQSAGARWAGMMDSLRLLSPSARG